MLGGRGRQPQHSRVLWQGPITHAGMDTIFVGGLGGMSILGAPRELKCTCGTEFGLYMERASETCFAACSGPYCLFTHIIL